MNRVRVYRNLRTGGFSVLDKRTRRVIDHAHVVVLDDAIFVVSKKGNERARKEGQRNVHAFVEGVRTDEIPHGYEGWPTAYYNPHRVTQFVDSDGRPVRGAKRVVLAGKHAFYEE